MNNLNKSNWNSESDRSCGTSEEEYNEVDDRTKVLSCGTSEEQQKELDDRTKVLKLCDFKIRREIFDLNHHTDRMYYKDFLNTPCFPTNKLLHEDLRKFRAVTAEGVQKLEVSIMSQGWTETPITDVRVFPYADVLDKYKQNGWQTENVDIDKKKYEFALEEGNHRQRALQNLFSYFETDPKKLALPSHLKPFEHKFANEDKFQYLPKYIICKKTKIPEVTPGYARRHAKNHMEKSLVIPFTIYQSFKIMAQDYDEWLQTNPTDVFFKTFAADKNYEQNTRNKVLYSFLFLREDKELVEKWERDDMLEYNRITFNNLLKTGYPGTTSEEKNRWKKEHLRHMLDLPKDKVIKTSAMASKLIKLLSEGKIKDYSENIRKVQKTNPVDNKKVSLKADSLSGDVKNALQLLFPDKTLSEIVVKFA